MLKKRITVRGVDEDVVDMLRQLREEEGRFTGHILCDAVRHYWDQEYEEENAYEAVE